MSGSATVTIRCPDSNKRPDRDGAKYTSVAIRANANPALVRSFFRVHRHRNSYREL